MGTRLPVRKLIAEEILAPRPDFSPVEGYWPYMFRRARVVEGETFYDIIALASSQKYALFNASVAWGLFPSWAGSLGGSPIRSSYILGILCGRTRTEDLVWEHDGSELGARETLRRLSRDLADVAEPWFDRSTATALAHPLVRLGLKWIRAHPESRTAKQGLVYNQEVREELSRILRRRAFELQLDMTTKKDISTLTYELVEFASDVDNEAEEADLLRRGDINGH